MRRRYVKLSAQKETHNKYVFAGATRGILLSGNEKHFQGIIAFCLKCFPFKIILYIMFIILSIKCIIINKIIKTIEENSLPFFLNL